MEDSDKFYDSQTFNFPMALRLAVGFAMRIRSERRLLPYAKYIKVSFALIDNKFKSSVVLTATVVVAISATVNTPNSEL